MNISLKTSCALVATCILVCATSVRIQAETAKAKTRITVRIQAQGGEVSWR